MKDNYRLSPFTTYITSAMTVAKVTIRQFAPKDHAIVCKIFKQGMKDNYRNLVVDALKLPASAGACVLAPAACAGLLHSRGVLTTGLGIAGTAVAAAVIPAAVAGWIWKLLADYTRYSLSDDLADVPKHYMQDKGNNFWVAELDGEVVGCVAIQARGEGKAELRRMSVKPGLRRAGVATQLAHTLIRFAHQQAYQEVYLTTTSSQRAAIALYTKLGWATTKVTQDSIASFHHLSLDVAAAVTKLSLK
mmetsp:Transcript_20344/g.51545  ORF Transcript_20344/g.51545 Transcript_20344/m.51545 type:complete len:247 (-) Transcript_20344:733-1473(-)